MKSSILPKNYGQTCGHVFKIIYFYVSSWITLDTLPRAWRDQDSSRHDFAKSKFSWTYLAEEISKSWSRLTPATLSNSPCFSPRSTQWSVHADSHRAHSDLGQILQGLKSDLPNHVHTTTSLTNSKLKREITCSQATLGHITNYWSVSS